MPTLDPQHIVLATLAGSLVLFVTDALRYDIVALLVVILLAGTQCLRTEEAFAGFAPVSGTFWRPVPARCAGPAPVFHIHGTADRVVPVEGRSLAGGRLVQGDVRDALEMMRAGMGCAAAPGPRSERATFAQSATSPASGSSSPSGRQAISQLSKARVSIGSSISLIR